MIASLIPPRPAGRSPSFGLGRLSRLAMALLIAAGAGIPVAWAQDANLKSLYDRVDRLQRDMNTLQQHIYRGESPPATLQSAPAGALPETQAARIEVMLQKMQGELRGLTGQLEEQSYRVGQMSQRLDKLVADVDQRLQQLEQRTLAGLPLEGAAPAAAADSEAAPAEAAAAPRLAAADFIADDATPEQTYERAFELLSQKNYAGAETVLQAFLERHPDDKLSGNAKYWLGETFYVRGLYAEAAVTFAEGYQTYPESVKAPDNLLKLGKALAALGQKGDACGTFAELRKRYGNASSLILQQAKNEQTRLSCP